METALEFFDLQFDPPATGVMTENGPRTGRRQIGHNDFDFVRPIVSPLFGQHHRGISQMMERDRATVDPVIFSQSVRFKTGDAMTMAFG